MQIKKSIRLTLRTDGDDDDKLKYRPVKIRISYNGYRVEISSGYAVASQDWDAAESRMKPGTTAARNISANDVNIGLSEYITAVDDAFKSFEVERRIPSPAELKSAVTSRVTGVSERRQSAAARRTIQQAYEEFVQKNGPTMAWSKNTYKKFATLWKDLNTFKPGISFDDLGESGLSAYLEWLRKGKVVPVLKRSGDRKGERGIKDYTVKKHLSDLRRFLKWAEVKNYPVNPAYKTFYPRYRKVSNPVIYLTEDEIRQVWNLEIPDDGHAIGGVRDTLIFCCYTGLRYSDLANLRRGDLHDGYIDVTTKKTADSLRIEYNRVSKYILDKYAGKDYPDGRALPVISNQKMNQLVKEVCRQAGVDAEVLHVYYKGEERRDVRGPKWKFVSTHTGRRSFICNGLARGIPVHVMMKWTGHSSYDAMKPYIDAVDSVKAREMEKFNLGGVFVD